MANSIHPWKTKKFSVAAPCYCYHIDISGNDLIKKLKIIIFADHLVGPQHTSVHWLFVFKSLGMKIMASS